MTRWTSTGPTWWWCLGCGLLVEATVPYTCARCSCESFGMRDVIRGTPASQAYLICCASHLDIEALSEPDAREWRISALCPGCWAQLAPAEDEL